MKITNNKLQITNHKKGLTPSLSRGFSMFLAIIVVSTLLIIAFSVTNIAVRQTEFSATSRESQLAYFAADAGVECAIYWDTKFAVSKFDPATGGQSITCNGTTVSTGSQAPIQGTTTSSRIGGGGSNIVSVFGFSLNSVANPTSACVIVNVTKPVSGTTHISSYGYNTCDISNPRRVERGIEVDY